MNEVVAWRAWYADGGVYQSEEMDWSDLPNDGVVYVTLFYKETTPDGQATRRFMVGEWYFRWVALDDSVVYGHTTCSKLPNGELVSESVESILERYPGAEVKRGKWVSDEMMERIHQEATIRRVDDPCVGC